MNYQIIEVVCFGYTCPGKTTKDSARPVFVDNLEVPALTFLEYLSTTVDAEKSAMSFLPGRNNVGYIPNTNSKYYME